MNCGLFEFPKKVEFNNISGILDVRAIQSSELLKRSSAEKFSFLGFALRSLGPQTECGCAKTTRETGKNHAKGDYFEKNVFHVWHIIQFKKLN